MRKLELLSMFGRSKIYLQQRPTYNFSMEQLDLSGTFYKRRGRGKKPVIYVDAPYDDELRHWRTQEPLFTKWYERTHPLTGEQSPVLYPKPAFAKPFKDGNTVAVRLGVRHEIRGNGLTILDVSPVK